MVAVKQHQKVSDRMNYYHGTSYKGSTLLPAGKTGCIRKSESNRTTGLNVVFISKDEKVAALYGAVKCVQPVNVRLYVDYLRYECTQNHSVLKRIKKLSKSFASIYVCDSAIVI